MTNKRKFERFELNVPSRIELLTQDGEVETLEIETNSLSAGGLFFKYGGTLTEGSQVKMEIALHFEELKTPADPEGNLVITATGHVLRSGPEGVAIRFNEDFDISTALSIVRKRQ